VIRREFEVLKGRAVEWLRHDQGYRGDHTLTYSAELRYRGQSFEIDTPLDPDVIEACDIAAIAKAFNREHERVYGHSDPHAAIQVISLRLIISGKTVKPDFPRRDLKPGKARPIRQAEVWLDGAQRQIDLYRRTDLVPGQTFSGPAVVTQDDCTTVVPRGYVSRVDEYANLRITPEAAQ